MHVWLGRSLPEGFSPPPDKRQECLHLSQFYSQPNQSGLLTSMSGWRPLTFFLLVHQQALCGQSTWGHQTLLPDTAAETVSELWGRPEPRGWPPPPPGRGLDWLRPWWRRASWRCAHPLAGAKHTVSKLSQRTHDHTLSPVQARVLCVEKKTGTFLAATHPRPPGPTNFYKRCGSSPAPLPNEGWTVNYHCIVSPKHNALITTLPQVLPCYLENFKTFY